MADLQESNASCPICLDLHKPAWTLQDFNPIRNEHEYLFHWFSPEDVVESAEKGCRGCRLITRVFPYDLSDATIQEGCLLIERPCMNVKILMSHVLQEESYEDSRSGSSDWLDFRELLTTFAGPKVEKISLTGGSQDTIALDLTTDNFSLRRPNIALCVPEKR
jgi:hypothetical protein